MSTSIITPVRRCTKCNVEYPATNAFFHINRAAKDGLYCRCKTCHYPKKPKEAPKATKCCTLCNEEFPNTSEYFRAREGRNELSAWCFSCHRLYNRDRARVERQEKRDRLGIVPLPDGLRKCGVCQQILPATREFFTTCKMGKNGLQSYCKPCGAATQRKGRKEKPEAYAEYEKRRDIPKRRAAGRVKNRKPRGTLNPIESEKAKVKNHNRRAMKLGIEGQFTLEDLRLQYRSQRGRCWWCQKNLGGVYQPDHLTPFDKGGTNWPNNIVCSCAFCNYSKGPKLPHKWIKRLF